MFADSEVSVYDILKMELHLLATVLLCYCVRSILQPLFHHCKLVTSTLIVEAWSGKAGLDIEGSQH